MGIDIFEASVLVLGWQLSHQLQVVDAFLVRNLGEDLGQRVVTTVSLIFFEHEIDRSVDASPDLLVARFMEG